MAGANKELRIEITGNADKFGEAAKKAEAYINELKKRGLDVLTAGIATGGALALADRTIDAIKSIVADIRVLIARAENLNVSKAGAARLDYLAKTVGTDTGTIDSGVQQLRRNRSDALAGDESAIKAFAAIGLSLEQIQGLKADELFFRILDATKTMANDAESYYKISRLIGADSVNATMPYFKGGGTDVQKQVSRDEAYNSTTSWVLLNTGKLTADVVMKMFGTDFASLGHHMVSAARKPFEPFSDFGIANRPQANEAKAGNKEKLDLLKRSELATEQRINEVIGERLRLVRLIEAEKDPVKRQKYIGESIGVEAELAGLVGKRRQELLGGGTKATTDPLRAMGADLSRFAPSLSTNIAQQQVTELRSLRATMEHGLQRIATLLAEDP